MARIMREIKLSISSNRIADAEIYKNKDFYEEPKEYFRLVLSTIEAAFPRLESLMDVGCANGSFLFHAHNKFKGACLFGVEPVSDLAEIARENNQINVFCTSLFEMPEKQKYQVITMLGVLGIFFDVVDVLKKLKCLLKEDGAIFIFSPFNEEDIDVILNYRRAPFGEWESGHNLFSKCTLEAVAKELGMSCDWIDFEMSKPILKTDDPMRSWTEPFRKSENHLIYGTGMLSTMKLLIVRQSKTID
jgi:SAM-dependent methyltransferase